MARDAQCTEVVAEVKRLFPKRWLEETARSCGWVLRLRKVSPQALFWTLVLGFGVGRERTLASLRRAYEVQTGTTLVPSAFYDRFTEPLVGFLRCAVARGCAEMAKRARPGTGSLFDDVVSIDSTVLRLHDALASRFPGTRTHHSPAAAKLHLVTSVLGRGPRSVKITDERTHDARVRHLGAWVRDNLLLFDMGYYNARAFSSIRREGGYFITRMKRNANPELRGIFGDPWTSLIQPGAKLRRVLARTCRDVLDLTAELRFTRRTYRGTCRDDGETFRIVAIRDPESRSFHVYVTNITAEQLPAADIATTYAGRWAIELIFKELKSAYRLDHLPSTKKHVVEALILVAVLTLIVSRRLLRALARRLPDTIARRLRPLRWSKVFVAHAAQILSLVLDPRRLSQRARARWLATLMHQAVDPNVERRDLRDLILAAQVQ